MNKFPGFILTIFLLSPFTGLCAVDATAPIAPPLGQAVAGPFQSTAESLRQYQCPDWFRDAKFGIYAHWGPYSISGGSGKTDWYSRNMYLKKQTNYAEHLRKFGPVDKFGYKDLIPLFTGEKFNADEWVKLYVEAGARFAGPVAEHADGFSMWDSRINSWNAKAMGPKRDVVGEMEQAIRRHGLKFVTTMHHSWKWGWYPTADTNTDCSNPAYAGLYGSPRPLSAFAFGKEEHFSPADPRPTEAFIGEWLGKIEEMVGKYHPDLLYFDTRLKIIPEQFRLEMAAFYYNQAAQRRQPVVLTYKFTDLPKGDATLNLERARMPDIDPDPWLTSSSIIRNSWAYTANPEYYSAGRLVSDLVDIVSKNGCLLLNVAPAPDGTIPVEQKERLQSLGAWLRLNGDAIYGTRPWKVFGEGPTKTLQGGLADLKFNGFSVDDIRFTRSKDGAMLYAIVLGLPHQPVRIRSLASEPVVSINLLGSNEKLEWKQEPEALVIVPPSKLPCEHAIVFAITLKKP